MAMISLMFEQLVVLVAHAISGIYSSDLKYSKKTTFSVWGIWVVFQGIIGCFSEFVTKDVGLKFFLGFVTAYVFQYIIFFCNYKRQIFSKAVYYSYILHFLLHIHGAFYGDTGRFSRYVCYS